MKNRFLIAILLWVAIAGMSCSKDKNDDPKPNPTNQIFGSFSIEMEYVFGHDQIPFVLNQALFHPMTSDTLTYTTFKHYVSNIRLKRTDGSWWKASESYFLLDASDEGTLLMQLKNVPAGDYTALELTMGIDSARNVSGSQAGVLDPSNGMYWNSTDGYIMIKAEGTSPQSITGSFNYHLGGYAGAEKAWTILDLDFPNNQLMSISPSASPIIHLLANPARLFHRYGSVSNGESIENPGVDAATMAQDFNTWVRIDHIHM